MLRLNNLTNRPGSRSEAKRVGRGVGSGWGKTSGKGHKGQQARSGVSLKGFEGGQMPLHRRLPKRGFVNVFRKCYAIINLQDLQYMHDAKKIDSSAVLSIKNLTDMKKLKVGEKLKILGQGTISFPINIETHLISKKAKDIIEKAGGKVIIISSNKSKE